MTVVPLGIDIQTTGNGARNLDELVPAAQRVERAVDKMTASVAQDMRAVEASTAATGRSFSALGNGQIQNVAFQLGDFATQVGAGTSASVALAQQLPQLLGGFGALGAVLGAVAAIGIPLASHLLNLGASTESLSDRTDSLREASERLSSALDNLGQSNFDLVAAYGANAAAMREVLGIQAELLRADFGEKMRAQASAIAESFGSLNSMISTPSRDALGTSPTELALQNIQDQLNATAPAAQEVLDRINALSNASTVDEQAKASLELARAMAEAAGGANNLTGAALEMYRALADTAQAGFSASSALSAAGASADNAAAQFSRATEAYREFQRLQALGEAQSKARLDQRTSPLAATEDSRSSASRGVFLSYEDRLGLDRSDPRNPNYAPPSTGRRSGGGGGGRSDASRQAEQEAREMQRQAEARQRIIDGLKFELEAIGQTETAQRIANETRRAGVDIMSAEGQQIADYVEQIAAAEAELERIAAVNEFLAGTFADLFTSAIGGADDFKDALGGVLAQLGQMAAQQAMMNLIKGSGIGAGPVGGLLSSVFGIGMPSYASGTGYHPGGPARINERGGEIVNLPRGSQVIPHDVSMAMARGGQQEVAVAVEFVNNGEFRAYQRRQNAQAAGQAVSTVRKGAASTSKFWNKGRP